MTLQQAITLLRDLSANHKENRALIQKELGNLRSEGFEVKVALNGRTSALVADVERLLTKLTAVKHMQQVTLVQVVTQQPLALDATTEAVIVQADPIQSFAVEESLQAIVKATVEQTVTPGLDVRQLVDAAAPETFAVTAFELAVTLPIDVTDVASETQSVDVSFDAEAAKLETDAETRIELVEAISEGEASVTSASALPLEPATRKTLTEIMAMPIPKSTTEEERELAMLEELFAPREQTGADKSEATLSDIHPSETLLQNSSHLCKKVKSFESIVLVLVVVVLVFKAIVTVIKAIEESQAATVGAKSFEQMYVAVGQKVRYRSKGFVKGFAVA